MYTDEVIKKKQGKKSKWSCIIFVDFVKSMTRVLVDNLCVRIIKLRMDNLVSNGRIFFSFQWDWYVSIRLLGFVMYQLWSSNLLDLVGFC
jgi:hypothetical protein